MWNQTAVGVDPFLDVGEVPVLDDAVQALGATHQEADHRETHESNRHT